MKISKKNKNNNQSLICNARKLSYQDTNFSELFCFKGELTNGTSYGLTATTCFSLPFFLKVKIRKKICFVLFFAGPFLPDEASSPFCFAFSSVISSDWSPVSLKSNNNKKMHNQPATDIQLPPYSTGSLNLFL